MLLVIKTILIISVLCISTFIGYALANKYSSRVLELRDLLMALEIFETKIKYTYDSLTTSFMYIADNLKTKVYRIFFITAQEVNENKNDSAGDCFKNVIDNEKIFLNLNKDYIEILK